MVLTLNEKFPKSPIMYSLDDFIVCKYVNNFINEIEKKLRKKNP